MKPSAFASRASAIALTVLAFLVCTVALATAAAASLATPRAQAAAVRLADGRVLVIGGVGPGDATNGTLPQAGAEIFDPSTGTWSAGGSMLLARRNLVALALPGGAVLVIGNASEPGCELYDVATASFTATACVATPRNEFAAAVLADGRVLVAGGWVGGSSTALATAEIRDFATGLWSPTGSLTATRTSASAVTLGNGQVLIAGGSSDNSVYGGRATSELYDPVTSTFAATGTLATARSRHALALLGDGNVVATGGVSNNNSTLSSVERYDVALGTWRAAGSMSVQRWRHTATLLGDGDVLLAGGTNSGASQLAAAELVDPACVATAAAISPASASFTPAGGAGIVTVTHAAGCSWKVAGNFTTWLTVTSGAQGVGNGEVAYSVAANTEAFPRNVTLTIADHAHAVSQAVDVCGGTAISPGSLSLLSGGGSSFVTVTAPAACAWTVTGAPAWITAPAGGTGNATITIGVATNAGGARNAALSVANRNLLVSQSANPCAVPPTISPASRSVGSGASTTTVSITTSSGCSWTNSGYPSWITMPQVGSGSATINVNVAANPNAVERSATFPVAGNTFSLTQAANFCATAAISPASQSVANTGGAGSIAVTAHPSCAWSAAGVPSWVTITSGASGSGDGTVAYTAAANSGPARSATLTVAGRSFSVSQPNGPCYPQPTIFPTSANFSATGTSQTSQRGATGSVNVTAPAGCAWNVAQVPAWVTITSALPATGSGVLTYTVAPNTGAARNGSFNIAGAALWYSVSQSAPGAATTPAATRMSTARQGPAMTTLADGRVLVAGGLPVTGSLTATASAEIHDPATAAFSATGSMTVPRSDFAAVRLGDGRVLAIGGLSGAPHASAEIYDPATGTWSPTGSMSTARRYPLAVLLADGRVLVTSGDSDGISFLTSSEVYDPATGTFTPTGATLAERGRAAAALLGDGRVLLAGGSDTSGTFLASAETWDPATGLWNATAAMAAAREGFTATPLLDGRVLVAGGYAGSAGFPATAEIYDPATNVFSAAGDLVIPRSRHVATALTDGSVVLTGGYYSVWTETPYIERYNPASGAWLLGGTFSDARVSHGASRLANGRVFAAGGTPGPIVSAETFDPAVCAAAATLSPASVSIAGGGGTASVSVSMAAGCPRVVNGTPSWITITAGASGNGSGTVSYTVAANTGAARSAALVIGGATHTVSQAVAPPASYCPSRGSSGYEWIQQVAIAGQVRTTGNNGGYVDSTAATPIALSRSGNAYTLMPGFSSSAYFEHWRVWIDFNGDGTFSDTEIVASGSGTAAISSSFAIPASAPAGSKRMRISMKWNSAPAACGSYSYGEVEDYTVTIP